MKKQKPNLKMKNGVVIAIAGLILYIVVGFDGRIGMAGWMIAMLFASGLLDGE